MQRRQRGFSELLEAPFKYNTVLIIDDSPENFEIIDAILQSKYLIKTATCGKKAIELAKNDPRPDLILLDIVMPGMSGCDICARLKSDKQAHNIPIIFITSTSDLKSEEKGLELGAVDHITKTFNPSLARARVDNHVELKRHEMSLRTW